MPTSAILVHPPQSELISLEPPAVRVYRNAVATPSVKIGNNAVGALYDEDGNLIRASQRFCDVREPIICENPVRLEKVEEGAELVSGRSLYLGHMFGHHYGHFLTEMVTSLWPAIGKPSCNRILVHPFLFGMKRSDTEKKTFQMLNITKPVRVVNRQMVLQEVVVPERSWKMNNHASIVSRDVLSLLTARFRTDAGKRLYASRRFVKNRNIGNESEVEKIFETHGFEVFHPQDLSFREQLKLYGSTAVLAGFAGSNLHNNLLCPPGAAVISLGDGRMVVNPNQLVCSALMGGTIYGVPTRVKDDTVDIDHLVAGVAEAVAAFEGTARA